MYSRQKGTTNIVDETGTVLRDPVKIQDALKTVNNNLDSLPEYAGSNITDPANAPKRYNADGTLNTSPDRSGLTPDDPVAKYYAGLDTTAPTADEEAAIREKTRQQMQAQIDSINSVYAGILATTKTQGVDRLGSTRAIAARSGILGQDFGEAQKDKTVTYNNQAEQAVEQERLSKVNAVLQQIEDRASSKIEAERTRNDANAKDYISYLGNVQAEAKTNVATLAKSGIKLEDLSNDQYKKLLDQTGWNPMTLESTFNANKPKKAQIDYKIEKLSDGKVLFYGVDPTTGELIQKQFDYDVPPEYDLSLAADGTPLLFNKNTGEVKIAGGFKKGAFAAPRSSSGGGTLTERDRNAMAGWFSDASAKFAKNKGTDGKVDPGVYSQAREQFAAAYPDKVKVFDYAFSPTLSDTERKNLGLDKGSIDIVAQLLGQ